MQGTPRLTCSAAAAGVNGAGKTTQLQIISGALEPDAGTISREKPDMKVAYLTQEFDVTPTNTVRVRLCGVHVTDMDSVVQFSPWIQWAACPGGPGAGGVWPFSKSLASWSAALISALLPVTPPLLTGCPTACQPLLKPAHHGLRTRSTPVCCRLGGLLSRLRPLIADLSQYGTFLKRHNLSARTT